MRLAAFQKARAYHPDTFGRKRLLTFHCRVARKVSARVLPFAQLLSFIDSKQSLQF